MGHFSSLCKYLLIFFTDERMARGLQEKGHSSRQVAQRDYLVHPTATVSTIVQIVDHSPREQNTIFKASVF
jgi:hypothetical protein